VKVAAAAMIGTRWVGLQGPQRHFAKEAPRLMGILSITAPLLLATLSLSPADDVVFEHVDLIEVNHYYDDKGQHVFDQLIFYDWSPQCCRYDVRDWRLLKNPAQIPVRNWQRGDYEATWHDGNLLRKVHADGVRETWTQYDPELVQRTALPKEKRRELFKVRVTSIGK
jgi:hypothetical protein